MIDGLLVQVLREAVIDAWVRDEPPYRTTAKFSPQGQVFPQLDEPPRPQPL